MIKVKIEYENMVNITTDKGELRLIFNEDGSFRLITDLPTTQVYKILGENPDLGQYQLVQVVEQFGYPQD